MKNVMKEHTKEIVQNIKRIDALVEEVPDEMFKTKSKNYFINELIKQIEQQLAQMKIYVK